MENRRPISYSFEDIKRYRQGLMNREEMHAFEKASMEDPFLADALEGYMQADPSLAEQHLSNIRERVADKQSGKEKAVVVAMPQNRFGFMRVAAMVIVIIGAGLLTYQVFNKKEVTPGEEIAEGKKPSTNNNNVPGGIAGAPQTKMDTGTTLSSGLVKNGSETPIKEVIIESPLASAEVKKDATSVDNASVKNKTEAGEIKDNDANKETAYANVKPAKTPLPVYDKVAEDVTTNANRNVEKKRAQNNYITGRVVSTNNQPLANASIRVDNSKKSVVTDDAGNFSLTSPDSLVVATVETDGFLDTRVELRSNSNNTINLGSITLQPDPAFNEIAVIGLGTSRKTNRVADTLTAKPEGGWFSFKEHVASKLTTALDSTRRNNWTSRGEFELEFFVDADGNPKNLKVLNSTNPALNEELMNLVETGPKWSTRHRKARILIRY